MVQLGPCSSAHRSTFAQRATVWAFRVAGQAQAKKSPLLEHLGLGMGGHPRVPACVGERHARQRCSLERAGHGAPGNLRPKRFGCAVLKEHAAVVEQPRNAKARGLPGHACIQGDARAAQRAVGDGNRFVAEAVVDDLVPVEDARRLGTRDAVARNAENTVASARPLPSALHKMSPVDGLQRHQRAGEVEAVSRGLRLRVCQRQRGHTCGRSSRGGTASG